MDQLIPPLAALVEALRDCFRQEGFETFKAWVAAWIVGPGRHTLSEVWPATGLAARRHHDTAYAVFPSAVWEGDDLGQVLATLIATALLPSALIWLVVDDTLAHQRGAKVAVGGFCLDAVLSPRKPKVFRFGLNWLVLGIAVRRPCREDRSFCLPVRWRVYRTKGQPKHRQRTPLAAELAHTGARRLPARTFWLVADGAYINATRLKDRPANLHVWGPIRWDAALYALPPPRGPGKPGTPRKKGERLPTPQAMRADPAASPAEVQTIAFLTQQRELRVQVVRAVLGSSAGGTNPVTLVLLRDPAGPWRDEALVTTDPSVAAAFAIQGSGRRWRIEVAFFESKQYLGLHEPRVWRERSVEGAQPMAWFVLTVTVLWSAWAGHAGEQVRRERRGYKTKKRPTFPEMWGALRLQQWKAHVLGTWGDTPPSPETVKNLLHFVSAVR